MKGGTNAPPTRRPHASTNTHLSTSREGSPNMTQVTTDDLERIRDHLHDQAFLYESPDAYEAGTDAAIDALERVAAPSFDRSELDDDKAGAVSASGLVLTLEDAEVSPR